MSFREKSAWISFVLLVLLLGGALWAVYLAASGRSAEMNLLAYYHNLLVAFVALQILLHIIVVVRAPKDARAPKDERERLIELKAFRIGFYTLLVAELLALFPGAHMLPWDTDLVFHMFIMAIMVGWLAKLGSQLVYYRLGG